MTVKMPITGAIERELKTARAFASSIADDDALDQAEQELADLRQACREGWRYADELRQANIKLVVAINLIRETLNGAEVQDLHQIINSALAEYRGTQKPSAAQQFGTDLWAGLK